MSEAVRIRHRLRLQTPAVRLPTLVLLGAILVVVFLFATTTGAVSLSIFSIAGGTASELERTVFFDIRLPRVFLAALVGAGLAISGACLQGLFRNPLADPGLIGVSSGAAMGAVIYIAVGSSLVVAAWLQPYVLSLSAVVGAMLCTSLLYVFAGKFGRFNIVSILLVGIAVNSIAGVVVGIFQYVSDDGELRSIVFWLMGSFGRATWTSILPAAVLMVAAIALLLQQKRALDLLQLGESEAYHLGVNIRSLKRRIIFASATAVGAGVALVGMVGFVGLVIPHIVRLIVGSTNKWVLPGSALLGASLTVLADTLARTAIAPAEIPVSLVTSALGAPFFLWLLTRSRFS